MKKYFLFTLGFFSLLSMLYVVVSQGKYQLPLQTWYNTLEYEYQRSNSNGYTGMMIQPLLDNAKNFASNKFPVKKAFNVLNASKKPTFSFLYGSYGTNPENYYKLMDMLAETGKPVKVVIHILCGPCRPPRRGSPVSFAPWFTIGQLNKAILSDSRTQKRYLKRVRTIRKRFLEPYPKDLYPKFTFVLVVELEDNLTSRSYKKFYQLTKKATSVVDDKVKLIHMRNRSYHILGFIHVKLRVSNISILSNASHFSSEYRIRRCT